MTIPSPWHLTTYAWTAFAIYWVVSARGVKRTAERESLGVRIPHVLVTITAFLLLLKTDLPLGPLDTRFVPVEPSIRWTGVALTWLGVILAIWARWHIGKNWSGMVTLKQDHQLVDSGPYRWVRHPIYSGLLLAVIGTALVLGEWRGVLAIAMLVVTHLLKARREEALMTQHFGGAYEAYKRRTGFLVPRLG